MRKSLNKVKSSNKQQHESINGVGTNGFIPNSFRFISSCIKTVSTNVRSAGASVAGSISGDSDQLHKDQVLWACFDRLELNPSSAKRVLLLGYSNGFQVLDVEDATSVSELVSRRDDPVTFLQMQPIPEESEGREGFSMSHPLLLVVASDEARSSGSVQNERDGYIEPQMGTPIHSPTAVRFYSLRSHNYVHVLRFRSPVYMVRCSPRIVAVGLAAQIYCFDALTLENRFSVLTYPAPQLGGQGFHGINIGYGPMAVGPRWLAYSSNNPMLSNTGRLSPQTLSPSPGVSPSTSPGSGSLMARYAMESSKHLAAGLINLGDIGYKSLSKYCHDHLLDGSGSPVSSNSSWKAGRVAAHSSETDAAGMVVVKDFVSRAVVSQFRAHTSPISALCFDPSGMLLVTASIHGNNINIFRILPSSTQSGSGTRSFDWASSHVHLYKLHRGMTSAVIQDICFSHYSQWIAIVSSRGTCHIFVLSPFGGETGLQMQNSLSGPTLVPSLSLPWWSSSSFMVNQSFSSPLPVPITLSVVSRIKNVYSGWLNTVSNAASSATGKVSVPSGVIAAAFHSSVRQSVQPAIVNANALEHLLVYTPSGYVIQYELLPSLGGDQSESTLSNGTASLVQMQEEDLRVKVEAVQWWDVCRRADWPEREEFLPGIAHGRPDAAEIVMDTSDYEDNDLGERELVKPQEGSHWYLSNAEVQVRSGRVPVWQKSKIYFYVIESSGEPSLSKELTGGETDVEKLPVHEVDVRRKDLLPVFDHVQRNNLDWTYGRGFGVAKNPSSIVNGNLRKFPEATVVSHANLRSPCANLNQHDGSSRSPTTGQHSELMETHSSYPLLAPANEHDGVKRPISVFESPRQMNHSSFIRVATSVSSEESATVISSLDENYIMSSPSSFNHGSLPSERTIAGEVVSSDSVVTSEASNPGSNRSDSSMNIIDEGPLHEDMQGPLYFGQYFQEEYCQPSILDGRHELTEGVTDVDSNNSASEKEKTEEDNDSDDMLGCVFAFSEEG